MRLFTIITAGLVCLGMTMIAMATSVKITIEGAMETDLGSVAGQVIEAELEKWGARLDGM